MFLRTGTYHASFVGPTLNPDPSLGDAAWVEAPLFSNRIRAFTTSSTRTLHGVRKRGVSCVSSGALQFGVCVCESVSYYLTHHTLSHYITQHNNAADEKTLAVYQWSIDVPEVMRRMFLVLTRSD